MISLIAAIGKNRELGRDNKLLWHLPEDLKRFKELTNGHPIIMGRMTFESIGRVLPNRTNIVITRNPETFRHSELVSESLHRSQNPLSRNASEGRSKFGMTDLQVVNSLEEAVEVAQKTVILSERTERSEGVRLPDRRGSEGSTQDSSAKPQNDKEEIFIIGGGQIFKQAMEKADKLYLTIVDREYEADTFFPKYDVFSYIANEQKSSYDGLRYTFLDLEKPRNT